MLRSLRICSIYYFSTCFLLLSVFSLFFSPESAQASEWDALIERLEETGLHRGYIHALFARNMVRYRPEVMARKMDALTETYLKRKAGEKQPVPYEERALLYAACADAKHVEAAQAYMNSRKALFDAVENEFGVPREIMTALLQMETRFGEYLGEVRVFINLASMAASVEPTMFRDNMNHELPTEDEDWLRVTTQKKADWAFEELVALIQYARQSRRDPLNILGSVYGAIGICQFMPTNAQALGVDKDENGVIDLFCEADAVASMARYLQYHGWQDNMSEEQRKKTVWAYNHSKYYVQAVLTVADALANQSSSKR